MEIEMLVSIPSEDIQGNQVDIHGYANNWQDKFGEYYSDFRFDYVIDDGTVRDKIMNKYELEEEGYDIDDIKDAMQEAHSFAYSEESSYLTPEEVE